MLSQTIGLRSRRVHVHRNAVTLSSTLCPAYSSKGACGLHSFEEALRRTIMKQKDDELRKQAVEFLIMEHESKREQEDHESIEAEAAARFTPSSDAIAHVIHLLKQERAYTEFSLELEVTKRMFAARKRRCPYRHHGSCSDSSQKTKKADEDVSEASAKDNSDGDTEAGQLADLMDGRAPAAWISTFSELTTFQKLLALVILRGHVVVPRRVVVADVAAWIIEQRQGSSSSSAADDELSDEEVRQAGVANVVCTVADFDTGRGLLNGASLPCILSQLATSPDACFTPLTALRGGGDVLDAAVNLKTSVVKDLLLKSRKTTTGSQMATTNATTCNWRLAMSNAGIPRVVREKECELSTAAQCQQFADVLSLYLHEWGRLLVAAVSLSQQSSAGNVGVGETGDDDMVQQQKAPPLQLRLLTLKHCLITSADHIIAVIKHHQLHQSLVGLDLSHNKLDSLRFLFHLRSDYGERLLFLGLANNPITKKPDYREQVRATLPNLIRLDGECIRRPPLSLPFGTVAQPPADMKPEEYAEVLAILRRFFYAWETQQVPRPPSAKSLAKRRAKKLKQREQQEGFTSEDVAEAGDAAFHDAWHFLMDGADGSVDDLCRDDEAGGAEEELDVDTLPKRYLHPDTYVSITVGAGCQWFDEALMRDAIAADGDDAFDGHRLSGLDMKELRVLDTSMRNHSRNLSLGKTALHRVAVGRLNAFTAYQSTLYPTRMAVQHHMDACRVHVHMIGSEDDSKLPSRTTTTATKRVDDSLKQKHVTKDPYAAKPTPHEIIARMMAEKKIGRKRGRGDDGEGAMSARAPCGPEPAPPVSRDQVFSTRSDGSMTLAAAPGGGSFATSRTKPLVFVVDMHGVMSWRSPTMHGRDGCIRAAYHRTITLVHRVLPRGIPTAERQLLPGLVVQNDMVTLMPPPPFPLTQGSSVLFNPLSDVRLQRIAVEYGLDGTSEGRRLVQLVAERATSDKCLHAVLAELVDLKTVDHAAAASDNKDTDAVPLGTSMRRRSSLMEPALVRQRSLIAIPVVSTLHEEDYRYALDAPTGGDVDAHQGISASTTAPMSTTAQSTRRRHVTLAEIDALLMKHSQEGLRHPLESR